MAKLLNISHDSVNRFILRERFTPKDLFDQAQSQLSVDDSVLDKPYSYHMALVGHFWSGKHHRSVKGINLITLYYADTKGHHLPVNYRLYDHSEGKAKNDYFLDRPLIFLRRASRFGCVNLVLSGCFGQC